MRTNTTPWFIAGVLLVLLVLVAWLWLGAKRDLEGVLAEGRGDIASQRDEIAQKCTGANADQEECDEALDEMEAILREFSADLSTTATSSTIAQ